MKASSELAPDHPAWIASARNVVNSIGDAGSSINTSKDTVGLIWQPQFACQTEGPEFEPWLSLLLRPYICAVSIYGIIDFGVYCRTGCYNLMVTHPELDGP